MAITLEAKAQFYQKLATGVKSGLTLSEIIRAQLLPPECEKAGARLLADIEKGTSFSKAFKSAGLVSDWEAELIHIGETGGRLEAVLSRLNDLFTTKLLQFRHIRGRLIYPVLVILAVIVILPLPGVVGGSLSVVAFLLRVIVGIVVLTLLYRGLLVRPMTKVAGGILNPLLVRSLRYVGDDNSLRERFEIAYLDSLTLCLESGMDAVQSLKLLQRSVRDKTLRKNHSFAISKVAKEGVALSEALSRYGILKHRQGVSFLASSEASGTLHSDMREYILRRKQALDESADVWIRRISTLVYIVALIYAALRVMPLLQGALIP